MSLLCDYIKQERFYPNFQLQNIDSIVFLIVILINRAPSTGRI